ncbi:MAG TPA: DUF2130 domain-containing protein [Chitinophagaceae bacterium]|nr:DUF2130 domain-containing protein [Chitinophagaceae bacterium]
MSRTIKCPKCGNEFEPNESIRQEIERELNQKASEWQRKKNEEFQVKLEEEKKRMQHSLEENIRKSISLDYENQLRLFEQASKENEEKLRQARQQQLEFLKKEQELKTKEAELELSVQKKLQEEREKLSAEIRKLEEQRIAARETEHQLQIREMQKQLEDQRKLIDEMKRKSEQGSMQLQGEVQELALEDMLKQAFPFDMITEVGKGVRGADCIQTVRNNFGQECGRIIYESKRTNAFASDWIEKLKGDMRNLGADIAVIVTRTMPKDMDCFGTKDGVWICSFSEVKALAGVLRDGVMRVFTTSKSNENKGDKMHLLYAYLTSNEFAEQWKAIREGFVAMRNSIQKERDTMERLWSAREKQLEKVLTNAARIRGSIDGISGLDSINLNLLETGEEIEDDVAH